MKKELFKNYTRNTIILIFLASIIKEDYISRGIMIFVLIYSIAQYFYSKNKKKSDEG